MHWKPALDYRGEGAIDRSNQSWGHDLQLKALEKAGVSILGAGPESYRVSLPVGWRWAPRKHENPRSDIVDERGRLRIRVHTDRHGKTKMTVPVRFETRMESRPPDRPHGPYRYLIGIWEGSEPLTCATLEGPFPEDPSRIEKSRIVEETGIHMLYVYQAALDDVLPLWWDPGAYWKDGDKAVDEAIKVIKSLKPARMGVGLAEGLA